MVLKIWWMLKGMEMELDFDIQDYSSNIKRQCYYSIL